MQDKIKKILEDLYIIDESFRKHEDRLIEIIEKFIEHKPDTKFDKSFAKKLRKELLREENLQTATNNFIYKSNSMFTMKKFAYAASALAVIVLAIAIWQNVNFSATKIAFTPQIQKLGSNAFGSLVATPGAVSQKESLQAADGIAKGSPQARGIGAGGGGGYEIESSIAPYFNYEYKYVGEDLELTDSQVEVLRRIKDKSSAFSIAGQIKGFDFGGVNLNSFSNLFLQNLTLAEDKDFGYMVSIVPEEGSISIHQNWLKWPNEQDKCAGQDYRCYDSLQLTLKDMPSDSILIGIADSFLREKGIDTQNYGQPFVDRSWITVETRYIGDQLSVVYPLTVNGNKVYEENGQPVGLNVSVDIRSQRAAGVWNLFSQNYEASNYEAETNFSRIKKFAENGGRNNFVYYGQEAGNQSKIIELGTPSLELVKIWRHPTNGRGVSEEFLVPSYIFPIVNKASDVPAWIHGVTVPLAKEILDEADKNRQPEPPVVEPVPLLEAEVGAPREGLDIEKPQSLCEDACGNGTCEEIVCQGEGCPCAETAENCPQDCS